MHSDALTTLGTTALVPSAHREIKQPMSGRTGALTLGRAR